jgi:hypothetical protein
MMVLFTVMAVTRMWYRAHNVRCRTVRVKTFLALSQLLNCICIMQELVTWPPSCLNPSIGTLNVSGCGCFFTILKTVISTKCWHVCFCVCVWSLSNTKNTTSQKALDDSFFCLHFYITIAREVFGTCMYMYAYLLKFITREERQNEWAADCMSSLVLVVLWLIQSE